MSLPWFQVGGVPDLLSSWIWAWLFFSSGNSWNSRCPEPRHPSSGPGMEVNSSLLAFAFLCFKIFHSWAVEFVHQESGGELKIFNWLVHMLQSDLSCCKFPKNKKALNFFWLSSSWLLPTDGEPGHRTQCWHPHSLAGLAYTSAPLALAGCLLWEVKVVGSGRRPASGTVTLGKGSAVSIKREGANMVFCEHFFQTRMACARLCMSLHIKHIFKVGPWKFKTTGWDGKHLSTCV